MIEVFVMRRMGWSPQDLAEAPARLVAAVMIDASAEGRAAKRRADEQRRESERMRSRRGG